MAHCRWLTLVERYGQSWLLLAVAYDLDWERCLPTPRWAPVGVL
jgi:hypothetical protein